MLHDIGRSRTHDIRHAQCGADLVREMGMGENLARIVECHTGAGLSADECTLLGLWLEGEPAGLAAAWWTVVYTGVVSVGLGYTLQAVGQRRAPPTDAAVILRAEAVFAAVAGWLFLDEVLSVRQSAGCGLLLAAMVLPAVVPPGAPGRRARGEREGKRT